MLEYKSSSLDTETAAFKLKPRLPLMRVRVSGRHLCKAEAPTEATAETVSCTKNSLPCVRGGVMRSYDGGVVADLKSSES